MRSTTNWRTRHEPHSSKEAIPSAEVVAGRVSVGSSVLEQLRDLDLDPAEDSDADPLSPRRSLHGDQMAGPSERADQRVRADAAAMSYQAVEDEHVLRHRRMDLSAPGHKPT